MACPTIITGDRFLTRTLEHIDCQAQTLGTFGYQSLSQPGSVAATVMMGLLTLFIALIGLRFLFGPGPQARDLVYDALKIGIVLTLAFSWPAFRTVVHDVVVAGPAEIAGSVAGSGVVRAGTPFVERLQRTDTAMVRLTEAGMGRNSNALIDEGPGSLFSGTALQDDSALGWSRLIWLAGTIGTFGLLRLLAGLLLALAPLAAGLLLFEATRGLFAGWLRGLVLTMIGSIGISVVLAVELAMLEPWLADAMRVRALGYGTPSGPIELFAMTLAFALIQVGTIWLLARVAFMRGWTNFSLPHVEWPRAHGEREVSVPAQQPRLVESRAQRTADSVERLIERQGPLTGERISYRTLSGGSRSASAPASPTGQSAAGPSERLGSSYRRTAMRSSMAAKRREGGS